MQRLSRVARHWSLRRRCREEPCLSGCGGDQSSEELVDLEEAAALAQYRAQQAGGTVRTVPHEQARARLGL